MRRSSVAAWSRVTRHLRQRLGAGDGHSPEIRGSRRCRGFARTDPMPSMGSAKAEIGGLVPYGRSDPIGVIEVNRRESCHRFLGQREADAAGDRDHGADRDSQLLPAPEVPLLK